MTSVKTKRNTTVVPEVLALTNYPAFGRFLSQIKRGQIPSIAPNSQEHRRLQKIAHFCINAVPTAEISCSVCGATNAWWVGVRSQDDGVLVMNDVYCQDDRPDPRSGIFSIPIRLASTFAYKGENKRTLQGLVKKAYGLPDRITTEEAKNFFAHLNPPTPWWVDKD